MNGLEKDLRPSRLKRTDSGRLLFYSSKPDYHFGIESEYIIQAEIHGPLKDRAGVGLLVAKTLNARVANSTRNVTNIKPLIFERFVGLCFDADKAKIWAKLIEEDFYPDEKIPEIRIQNCSENDSVTPPCKPEMDNNRFYKLNGNHKNDKECVKFEFDQNRKFSKNFRILRT